MLHLQVSNFWMLLSLIIPFLFGEVTEGTGEDIEDAIKEIVIEKDDDKKDDEEDEEEEGKETEDEEDKDEEDKDEEEEVEEYSPRPSLKDIKEKFPDLFKTFPQLRDMYFREQKLTAIFPTLEDAEQAKTDLDNYTTLELGLRSGKTQEVEVLLKSVGEMDENALPNFALNILPALQKVNEAAYFSAVTPVIYSLCREIYDSGVNLNNDNLKNTAKALAIYLWKNDKIATGESKLNLSKPKVQEENKEVISERTKFVNERHDALYTDVEHDYVEELTSLILDGIDPDEVMSEYIKNTLADDIIRRINNQLKADPSHQSAMKNLWVKASSANYSRDWKDRIKNAAMSRAKSIMPSIRAKARKEALGTSKRAGDKVLETGNRSREITPKSGSQPKSGKISNLSSLNGVDTKKIDYSKVSDMDILNGKIALK